MTSLNLIARAALLLVFVQSSLALAAGKFSSPVQNTYSINFDGAAALLPGPQALGVTGGGGFGDDFDDSSAGESAAWGSFGGAPDGVVADIVPNIGPNGAGDHAARLTITDATPGSHFSRLLWQAKGLVLGNSTGATASGAEPIPDVDNGLTVTVPVRTSVTNGRFRVNIDTGSQVRAGRYDDPMGGSPLGFVQGNVPGLIDNFAAASRILAFGTGTTGGVTEIGALPINTWGTQTTIGGVPVLLNEKTSAANGWGTPNFEPAFSRTLRSFDLTRLGVTMPGGGVAGEVMISEWTISGPDVLAYHPTDFNYDQMVDAMDIDMLFDAVAFLNLNATLPVVPDNNFNGALDFLPVAGVNRIPQADVTLPEKYSITKTDNVLNVGDADELVLNIMGTVYGDLDLDGVKEPSDRATLVANLNTAGGWALGDLNGDSMVTSADLAIFDAGAGLTGDFNGDGSVNAADYTTWRDGLGTTYTPAQYDDWKNNFNAGAPATVAAGAVPEPATWLLAALAGLGVALRSRS